MVYKVKIFEASTKIEIEACSCERVINLHGAEGVEVPERGGQVDYNHFFNVALNENQAKDLIKALELGIKDLKEILIKG